MVTNNNCHLVAWYISGVQEKNGLQKKLPLSSQKAGVKAQEWHTTQPGIAGQAGAINGKLILFMPLWPISQNS